MSDTPVLRCFMPAYGLADASPFPMKVMMFMRMHNIDFECKPGDPRKAPLGKIPYLEHAGKELADSELILDYLEDAFQLPRDNLREEQHAIGHMLCRTMEERLYWAAVYSRWGVDENFEVLKQMFFGSVPAILRGFIANKVRKDIMGQMYGHGVGRHTEETFYEFARRDLQAASDLLGDSPYLFGDTPTRYDCTLHAFVAHALQTEMSTPFPKMIESMPNLIAYRDRINSQYYAS